ncbi:MAG: DUF58 domain-containing protein [Lachnospiraceae bacterium]|nr:DUF58 domain-containing protein [Lachnospiraceae bacterium]
MIIIVIAGIALILYIIQDRLYTKYWDDRLTAVIRFQKDPVFEGEEASLTETVSNAKWLPLSTLHVKFQISTALRYRNETTENVAVSDFCYKHDIYSLMPYTKVNRTHPIVCTKRGYYTINEYDLASANIFLINHLVSRCDNETELYVFPKPIEPGEVEIPFQSMMGSIITRSLTTEDPFEFRGIRDYQVYDPMKNVNWKASAKSGDLMVNMFHHTAGQEVRILVNLEDESRYREFGLLEFSIRLAASLALRFLFASVPVSILTNGRDIITHELHDTSAGSDQSHMRALYEMLARVDLDQEIVPAVTMIEKELEKGENRELSYIMIGYCQREDLGDAFEELCKLHPGGLMILPLTEKMPQRLFDHQHFTAEKWKINE